MKDDEAVLVGDVGGTHARFAVVECDPFHIRHRLDLRADDFAGFDAVLKAYLDHLGEAGRPEAAAIGVAGPVTAGRVDFTNLDWHASEADLRKLGFKRALLINDFAAAAFSVTALRRDDLRTIGPEVEGDDREPITILGAGTGFGVSCLARFRGVSLPIATEGGHASFAPRNAEQVAVLQILAKRFGHVSIERVLSGPGLVNLRVALEENAGRDTPALSAEEIVRTAQAGDAVCSAAVDMFCAIFGSVAGDFALAHGARGGVYIAGGIAQKIEPILVKSAFRSAFEDKGRLSHYVKAIPTRLILHEDTAFLGAALAIAKFGSVRK
ncbi:MAG TPA: glucokinase [Rhizomicrobium sp.]|nr:glucokinase [Rhizomicrobium sp.]